MPVILVLRRQRQENRLELEVSHVNPCFKNSTVLIYEIHKNKYIKKVKKQSFSPRQHTLPEQGMGGAVQTFATQQV